MLGEFVSKERSAALAERGRRQTGRLLEFEPEVIHDGYNRRPFILRHHLAEHPAFELPQLFTLCRRMPREQVQYRHGVIPGDANVDSSFARFKQGLSFEDALDRFEETNAYICVYNPERDVVYRPLLEGLLAEIAAGIEGVDPVITWYSTYFFISTRDAVTPYHMDREMNFLLQVRGEKKVMLWDPGDEEIMNAAEKDRLLAAFETRRPSYKPSFEAKATRVDLAPGLGVHHPFIAPHRVHTGAGLSVSLAFTFRTQKSDLLTNTHAFNHVLRRCGWSPQPVGRHPKVDQLKALASHAVRVPIDLYRVRRRGPTMA